MIKIFQSNSIKIKGIIFMRSNYFIHVCVYVDDMGVWKNEFMGI